MDSTPIGSPRLSQTITPTPAKFEARNTAASKLTLYMLGAGGRGGKLLIVDNKVV